MTTLYDHVEMATMRDYETDVAVIGGGPAGLLAAVEARRKGCSVLLLDKGIIGHDCSAVGAKQLAAVGPWSSPEDSAELHALDTMVSGCGINNPELVRLLTQKTGEAVQDLMRIGMPFETEDDGRKIVSGGAIAGHSHPRSLGFKDITGKLLVDVLLAECRRRGVVLLSEHVATDLPGNADDGVAGILAFSLVSGSPCLIRAKAIVLATGGMGRLYALSSNPVQICGDGAAIALRAGAELMDLEFVQFYPVTVLAPQSIRGMNLNCHYYGAKLTNSDGERFMERYYPGKGEFVTRDKLAQAITTEMYSGKTGPNGGVFVDATMIAPQEYLGKIPTEWNLIVKAGVDTTRSFLEVAPSAHYAMGGIRIDSQCKTSMPRLFASGECSAGVQGANRLANNGLGEAIAFGSLAGKSAGSFASRQKSFAPLAVEKIQEALEEIRTLFSAEEGMSPAQVVSEIRKTMSEGAGVIRDAQGLKKSLAALDDLHRTKIRVKYAATKKWHHGILASLNARNMSLLGSAIIRAALAREESRGAHFRSDYTERNDAIWKKNLVVTLDEEKGISLRTEIPDARREWQW